VTFLTALALVVGVLVVAPYVAHRLRQRRAEEVPFPPARLVSPSPPEARRRSRLEDRALYATRTAAVVALALLGATPFVRCSRLSLQRAAGASVALAIVLDDSMSMNAPLGSGSRESRFERARSGAKELLASAREGDAVALVLAGAPARVALAATTDLAAARRAIDDAASADRATDLEGAVSVARGLIASSPQVDRRIVVLSDLADGHPAAPPLGESGAPPVWFPLPELRASGTDCAVLRADRVGQRVTVVTACGPGATLAGREVVVEDVAGQPVGRGAPGGGDSSEVKVILPPGAVGVRARLTGSDAVARDDVAPVTAEAGRGVLAVVADATDESVATGGPPVVEQALSALQLDVDVRSFPALPDRPEELAGALGVVLDDPPGMTPEQRHTIEAFLDKGGLVLLALGPHAAAAPLGATLEPVLAQAVAWMNADRAEVDPATAVSALLGPAAGLEGLGAPKRATLAPADVARAEALVKWNDGAPFVARRAMGRGEAWLVTLPFSVDASDLPLRAAFLGLLDAWVRAARERASPTRSEVATAWKFPGASRVEVQGPAGPIAAVREDGVWQVVPDLAGEYEVTVDGADRRAERRIATPIERELDLRPRASAPAATGEQAGLRRGAVDASGSIALVLLALMAAEMGLRLYARRGLSTGAA
jgi:hypothetical protein